MKTVKLIVYGTLLTGECNHHYCRNALSITPCSVTGTIYDTGWGYPAFQPEGGNRIKAELIEIPLEDWEAVDELEEYPEVYERQIFPAKLSDGAEVSGWIYIMNTLPDGAEVIESGDWKEYRRRKNIVC